MVLVSPIEANLSLLCEYAGENAQEAGLELADGAPSRVAASARMAKGLDLADGATGSR